MPEKMETKLKSCARCRREQPLELFAKHRGTNDGRGTYCRDCRATYQRNWRRRNPGKEKARNRARRVAHEPRVCVTCGETFTPTRSDSRRCQVCRADGLSTARALERSTRSGPAVEGAIVLSRAQRDPRPLLDVAPIDEPVG